MSLLPSMNEHSWVIGALWLCAVLMWTLVLYRVWILWPLLLRTQNTLSWLDWWMRPSSKQFEGLVSLKENDGSERAPAQKHPSPHDPISRSKPWQKNRDEPSSLPTFVRNLELLLLEGKFWLQGDEQRLLHACIKSAPLLGLLGTVQGVMAAFSSLHTHATADFSSGIANALLTTQLGLLIAVPGLWISKLIQRRASLAANDIDALCLLMLSRYQREHGGVS